jgi:hypothetical protein
VAETDADRPRLDPIAAAATTDRSGVKRRLGQQYSPRPNVLPDGAPSPRIQTERARLAVPRCWAAPAPRCSALLPTVSLSPLSIGQKLFFYTPLLTTDGRDDDQIGTLETNADADGTAYHRPTDPPQQLLLLSSCSSRPSQVYQGDLEKIQKISLAGHFARHLAMAGLSLLVMYFGLQWIDSQPALSDWRTRSGPLWPVFWLLQAVLFPSSMIALLFSVFLLSAWTLNILTGYNVF